MGRRINRGKTRGGSMDMVSAEVLSFPALDQETRAFVSRFAAENCDGWSLFFCQAEAIAIWRDTLEAAGAKYKRSMVWIKPDGMPQYNGQMPGMGYESIAAAWCGTGHSRWNGGGRHGIFTHCKNSGGKHEHETQKPIPLMRELVGLFTNPGDLVCDPFMGSGTTGIGCIKLGRRFVGCEINRHYFDIACRRIEQAYAQPDMFVQPPARATQEPLL
jgi:site-specific DNA-methyltransferase (adenine-specific)